MAKSIGRIRKTIRMIGGGMFLTAAAGSVGLGIANWIITWGKSAGDFQYSIATYDGGFLWDSAALTGIWGGVVLMMIGLGIYAATLKDNE